MSTDAENPRSAKEKAEDKEVRQGLYCLAGCFVFFLFFYLVIFLPLQLIAVGYDEYAFLQRRSTGYVDTDVVYTSGRYFANPDKRFKKFKATAHVIHFDDLSVFTDDKLEVLVDVSFFYFIDKARLKELHDVYEYSYSSIVEDKARAAIKNEAATHTTPKYFQQREMIESNFTNVVRTALEEVFCLLPETGVYLRQVRTPDEVKFKMLNQVVLNEDTIRKSYEQDSKFIRQETSRMVNTIANNVTRTLETVEAQALLKLATANAEAQLLQESARTSGLATIYETLGITDPTIKASLDYIRMLGEHADADIAVNFDTLFTS